LSTKPRIPTETDRYQIYCQMQQNQQNIKLQQGVTKLKEFKLNLWLQKYPFSENRLETKQAYHTLFKSY
ncbi:9754_t:CDS:1, partial [Dentiscutata heterogama]